MMINVIADRNIPYLNELLPPEVSLTTLPPEAIDAEAMALADALITRTRTRCDATLLGNSPCRLVATATIGTDHIDIPYCRDRGIAVASAPGCNAPAVAQYVWSVVMRTFAHRKPSSLTVGIVGVGNVGRIVEQWGRSLGYNILLCDPLRAEAEGTDRFVDLDTIARECDVITFHTPLTRTGAHPTYHLADARFFSLLARRPLIINSARGPVIDTTALLDALDNGLVGPTAIDCWEGEPNINPELLSRATYATPHIAGYSIQGKTRASIMAVQALCDTFGLTFAPTIPLPPPAPATVTPGEILSTYDPAIDTENLRANPGNFEQLRNNYPLRPEPGY